MTISIRKSLPLVLLFCLIGCKKEASLTFDTWEHQSKDPGITIKIPSASGLEPLATNINNTLGETVIATLDFGEAVQSDSIAAAITEFKAVYHDFRGDHPEVSADWEAEIEAAVDYVDKSHLSIRMNTYMYTGGAHGMGTVEFLNFDKVTGEALENWELFDDIDGFSRLAEKNFRIQEDIPSNGNINTTGFMFEGDRFHLPEQIGLTKKGVLLLYNPYEVASYADGSISLTIPWDEAQMYLVRKLKKGDKNK